MLLWACEPKNHCRPTRTEDVCDVNEDDAHVPLPAQNEPYHVPLSVHAEERKVLKDHSYSLPAYPLSVMFPIHDDDSFSTIPLSKLVEEESSVSS